MNRERKENYIRCWLQKFGERDNESFHKEIKVGDKTWELSLQYDYGDEGDQLEPYSFCRENFKHVFDNTLSDRTDEEIDSIIIELNNIKTQY